MTGRIHLSPPDMGLGEREALLRAFDSNWVSSVGAEIEGLESDMRESLGVACAVAVASGTAGLHLGLLALGIGPGDHVLVPSFTFAATANAVAYVGATPVFIDSDPSTWTLDPALVRDEITRRAGTPEAIRAVIPVDIFGQVCDYEAFTGACAEFGVHIIEDAAEAMGSTYRGRSAGTLGRLGVASFNGNKIMSAGSGGMVLTDDADLADRMRHLASQAREPVRHYEHRSIGYNYRMNNLLAAIARAQFARLPDLVRARRTVFARYAAGLDGVPGVELMPEADYGSSNRWLTVARIDPAVSGAAPAQVCEHLEAQGIEARPAWKPMHLQPVFSGAEVVGGAVSERIYAEGVCLPSGSALTEDEQDRVIEAFVDAVRAGGAR